MSETTRLGTGPEFDKIRSMIDLAGHDRASIGDDCAVLAISSSEFILISTDTSVENVHFKRDWMTFEEIGYRAIAAALSDIAAMGGSPLGVVVAYGVPKDDAAHLVDLARGAGAAAAASHTSIIGGDISSSETLTLTATVVGKSARPLRRSGARPGDVVCVTGTYGGPLRALDTFRTGSRPSAAEREKFLHPVPRIAEALWLAERGATSCIDISDGLAGDLLHLATASGVELAIRPEQIPTFPAVTAKDALVSGEEYELCATMPPQVDAAEFEKLFGIPLSIIGEVRDSADPRVTFKGISAHTLQTFNHFT